jgi:hypothetical protein
VLAEGRGGGTHVNLGSVGRDIDQRAELVSAHPVRGPCAGHLRPQALAEALEQ